MILDRCSIHTALSGVCSKENMLGMYHVQVLYFDRFEVEKLSHFGFFSCSTRWCVRLSFISARFTDR